MADDKKDKDLMQKFKSPQWRIVITVLLFFLVFYLWSQFFTPEPSKRQSVSYSQFVEQLDAGNIKSVTIKNLQVNGEFVKGISITPPEQKKAVTVKEFQTFLPSFGA